jgi:hypothetical protein
MDELIRLEHIEKKLLFVYAINGFTNDAITFFMKQNIAWCEDERWLDNEIKA